MEGMFFKNVEGLLRVLIIGVLAYSAVVLLLRVTGKRTLSKMNAFDLVVTVALGSTLATVLLSKDIALAEGVLAFAVLIFLQLGIAWTSARSRGFRRLVKAQPTLLLCDGVILDEVLVEERVAREEVLAAVRSSGYASLQQVQGVVLETDGSFSVIGTAPDQPPTALENVERPVPAASSDPGQR
jgi:uncharacterized membrane protein YcaP (DUF421 family)